MLLSHVEKLKNDQQAQIFNSEHDAAALYLNYPSFLNTPQDQSQSELDQPEHAKQATPHIALGGSMSSASVPSSSHIIADHDDDGNNSSFPTENGSIVSDGSAKWVSSKMRLMHRMMNSARSSSTPSLKTLRVKQKFHIQEHENSHINSASCTIIRVCSDCNTTTTPLWRSGPQGPKSLCNACGIRQRKARKAMAEAAAATNSKATATETSSSSTKIKVHKDKKPKINNNVAHWKRQYCRSPQVPQTAKNICLKDFAQSVFPLNEEQAAILLMELSCGFVHS